jgi:hypothetical protein
MKKTYNFFRRFTSARGLLKKSFAFASLMLLGTGAAFAQSSNPIGKPGLAGDFEVDADFKPGNLSTNCPTCLINGLDWRSVLSPDLTNGNPFVKPGTSNVANENAIWIVDGNSGSSVGANNHEVEAFAGSSNKNGDFVTLGASPYTIDLSNPSSPQKNDLTNIYIRSKVVSGKTWLVAGAETRSVDGTSYLDFEYNQAGMAKDATHMFGPASLASTGGRTAKTATTPGDGLFVVDFSKGGGVPLAKVFEWQLITKGNKSFYGWFELTSIPADKIFIVTNGNNVDPAGFSTAFAGNGAAASTTLALQFVEIGVNLTDVFGNFNPCAPEATILVKTRTSSSYTSELKDFSLFKFDLVAAADMENIADVAVCPSQDATFDAIVSGPGADPANVHWFKIVTPDDLATPANEEVLSTELITGGRITISTLNATTRRLFIDAVEAGDVGTYVARLSGATCGIPRKSAALILNSVDAPVITLLEPSVCFARAKGLLSVCNPEEGANYYLEQLDDKGVPIVTLHQEVLVYDPLDGALSFDLEPGYIFTLKVDKNGCNQTVDCDDLVTECPAITSPTSVPKKPNQAKVNHEINTPVNNTDLGQEKANVLTAYPVPFSEKVTVKFTAEKTESYVINLYNMHGKLIKELKSGNAKAGDVIKMEISGKGMIESLYVVKKISKSGISTVKLFKQE